MAITKKVFYPIDYTGSMASNHVSQESVTIGVTQYRAFTLAFAPFYADSLIIRENGSTIPLKKDIDYKCLYFYRDLSKLAGGKDISGVVVITNGNVGTDLVVSYQMVGGHYSASASAIAEAIAALELDNRNAYWQNIIDTPDLFQPAEHPHDFGDVYGLEWIISMLASIREAILIGDNAVHTEILNAITVGISNLTTALQNHVGSTGNVHNVTPEQLGVYTKAQIDNIVIAINKNITDLNPTFAQISSALTVLGNKYDALVGAVAGLGDRVGHVESEVSQLDGLIADLTQAMQQALDRIGNYDSEIAALKQADQSLSLRIDGLQTGINQLSTRVTQEVARLESMINSSNTSNDAALDALAGRVTKNESDIAKLKTDVSANTTSIAQTNAKFTDYVRWDELVFPEFPEQPPSNDAEYQASLNELKIRVTTLESNVGAINTRLTQQDQKIAAANQAISTNAQAISAANAKFDNYVLKSSLMSTLQGPAMYGKIPVYGTDGGLCVPTRLDWYMDGKVLTETVNFNSTKGGYQIYNSGYYNAIDYFVRSDVRDKHDIRVLSPERANTILRRIRHGITYQLQDEQVTTAGLAAQVVEKHFSEAVVSSEVELPDGSMAERLMLRHGALVGLLVSGYNHQAKEIAELRKMVQQLADELKLRQ